MKFPFHAFPIPVSLNILRKMAHFNPLIINYHVVSDERLPYIKSLYNYRNIKTFTEDLDFLLKNFNPIGLHDLLNHLKNGASLPDNSFMLTFDDGFREVHEVVLPLLLKKKLTATFFLTTGFLDNRELGYMNKKSILVDKLRKSGSTSDAKKISLFLNENGLSGNSAEQRILGIHYKSKHLLDELAKILHLDFAEVLKELRPYLTSEQVNDLVKEGMTIGSHSIDHPRYSELTLEEQVFQSTSSTNIIQERFKISYKVFAFPYTDLRISGRFFYETANYFDATFGTQGLILDCIPNNFQRVNVEKFSHSASKTLKSQYSRCILNSLTGRAQIVRKNT